MAIFNPQVPETQDPTYFHWSKPIDPVKADRSKEFMLSGVGNAIETTAKAADFVVKDTLQDTIYEGASKIRKQYTDQLEATKANMSAPSPQVDSEGKPVGPLNILANNAPTTEEEKIPTDLKKLPQNLNSLVSVRNNNKMTETRYYAELDKLASDLRGRFIGYRPYIDKKFEEVTGVDPANAKIKSLVQDINAAQANVTSAQNRALSLADQNLGIPGVQEMIPHIMNGTKNLNDLTRIIAPYKKQEYNFHLQTLQWNSEEIDEKRRSRLAGGAINDDASKEVNNFLNTYQESPGSKTPREIQNIYRKAALGVPGYELSDKESREMARGWNTFIPIIEQRLRERYYKPGEVDPNTGVAGRSPAQIHGVDATEQLISKHVASLKEIGTQMANKEWGLVGHHMEVAKDLANDTWYDVIRPDAKNQTLAYHLRLSQGANQAGGADFVAKILLPNTLGNFTSADRNWIAENAKKFVIPQNIMNNPFSPGTMPTQGAPNTTPPNSPDVMPQGTTLKKSMGEGASVGAPAEVQSKVLGMIPHIILSNAADPAKETAIENAFGPGNQGLLSMIQRDYIDPQGNPVKGKFAAFGDLTSEGMTKEVKRLSARKPALWGMYSGWARDSVGIELIPEEIGQLERTIKTPGVDVAFSDKLSQFTIMRKSALSGAGTPMATAPNEQAIRSAEASIGRINQTIRSVRRIAEAEGKDVMGVNAYILQTLIDAGAPRELLMSIVSSQPPKEEKPK